MNHEAPKTIWLQVDPDGDAPIGSEYPLCEGATWCQDKINNNDVQYFRADQLRAAKVEALREAAEWYGVQDSVGKQLSEMADKMEN